MKYKGGKGRIADEILAIMLNSTLPGQSFVDAFCGGITYTAIEKQWRIKNREDLFPLIFFYSKTNITHYQTNPSLSCLVQYQLHQSK